LGGRFPKFGVRTIAICTMTEFTSEFFHDDSGSVDRFEDMLRSNASYFFDVDELEAICDHYFDSGNATKARKAIEHGLSLHPGSNALLLKQAHVLLMTKQPKKALKILDFLEASEPANTEMLLFKAVVHRNLSDHEGTKACLMKALETTTENQEEIFLDLAFEQEMVEDYTGAIQSLKRSLHINPEHEACLFELGYCFDMADAVEDGVAFFQNFLDDQPYSFVGWYNLALCYDKLGLYEMALTAVDYCLAIKDDFTNAHIMKGNLLTNCDLDALAIDAYSESLQYDAQNPMVYAAIGECYERIGNSASAEHNYLHALSIDNDHVDSLMGMGALREAEEKFTEALVFYRTAVTKDEFHLDNWHIYAETLVKIGNLHEAEGVYMEMTQRFADDEESWTDLADVRCELKGMQMGVDTIEQAMEQIPQSTDLIWHMVKHLHKAGKHFQAEAILADAMAAHPEGAKYFRSIFPEAINFPNIAG